MSKEKKAFHYVCVASGPNGEGYASDRCRTVEEALKVAKCIVLGEWEEDDLEGFDFVVYTCTGHQVFGVESIPTFKSSPAVVY